MKDFASTAARLTGAAERVAASLVSGAIDALDDAELRVLLCDATEVARAANVVVAAASAVAELRSARERGAGGFAQKNGHRTVTSLVQNITGHSRAETTRVLRAGHDLITTADSSVGGDAGVEASDETSIEPVDDAATRWLRMLSTALVEARVSTAQHQAIRDGLGDPPVDDYPDLAPGFLTAAWARAVEILLDDATTLPVDELRAAARIARDRLDPHGVEARFARHWETRSFRRWIDEHGQHHARIDFDDEGAAWVDALLARATRSPRSPRFTPDPAEPAQGTPPAPDNGVDAAVNAGDAAVSGARLVLDERTTPQRHYDHFLAMTRTGAKADPHTAFGDAQPGVRIVIESAAFDLDDDGELRITGAGHVEDRGTTLPGAVIEKYLCDAGTIPVIADPHARPLDLGRERRLFTARQRTAILTREGGCIGHGCDAPASHTEIHHIDHWWEHSGRTDVDDGVPLCTPCHLNLHNTGARIRRTRDPVTGRDTYWLHRPPDPTTGVIPEPIRLHSRSPRRFTTA